jgi:NADP-dependent 3-hydroxy acid dehydrogenase YdfG
MATNRNGNFAWKVALVTGAASGIGRAARLEGYFGKPLRFETRPKQPLLELVDEIEKLYPVRLMNGSKKIEVSHL